MNKYAIMYKDNDRHVWVVERGFTYAQAIKQMQAIRGSHIYVVTRTGLRSAG